jgi:hypothetical protein
MPVNGLKQLLPILKSSSTCGQTNGESPLTLSLCGSLSLVELDENGSQASSREPVGIERWKSMARTRAEQWPMLSSAPCDLETEEWFGEIGSLLASCSREDDNRAFSGVTTFPCRAV